MDNMEVFDGINARGSAETEFSVGMHKEIKQENFYGWDAAEFFIL